MHPLVADWVCLTRRSSAVFWNVWQYQTTTDTPFLSSRPEVVRATYFCQCLACRVHHSCKWYCVKKEKLYCETRDDVRQLIKECPSIKTWVGWAFAISWGKSKHDTNENKITSDQPQPKSKEYNSSEAYSTSLQEYVQAVIVSENVPCSYDALALHMQFCLKSSTITPQVPAPCCLVHQLWHYIGCFELWWQPSVDPQDASQGIYHLFNKMLVLFFPWQYQRLPGHVFKKTESHKGLPLTVLATSAGLGFCFICFLSSCNGTRHFTKHNNMP